MTRQRPIRAVTLVEVMVTAAIAAVVLGAAVLVYNLSYRSRGVTASARALQTAMLIEERFTDDLLRLILVRPAPLRFWPDKPSRISFYAFDPAASRGHQVAVRGVVYSLDRPNTLLVREWAGRADPVGVSPLTFVEFCPLLSATGPLVRVTLEVGRDPDDPAGNPVTHSFLARMTAPRETELVKATLLSAFLDERDMPGDQRLPTP